MFSDLELNSLIGVKILAIALSNKFVQNLNFFIRKLFWPFMNAHVIPYFEDLTQIIKYSCIMVIGDWGTKSTRLENP